MLTIYNLAGTGTGLAAHADAKVVTPSTLWIDLLNPNPEEDARMEAALHDAVNRFRAQHHKIPLQRRADVDAVARGHSADMAGRRYLSHETPEGRNWVDRLGAGRVEGFTMAGENVGMTTKPNPNDEILGGWIHSKVHLDNLLAAPFNTTGLGIARSADGTLYYTQLYLNFPRD